MKDKGRMLLLREVRTHGGILRLLVPWLECSRLLELGSCRIVFYRLLSEPYVHPYPLDLQLHQHQACWYQLHRNRPLQELMCPVQQASQQFWTCWFSSPLPLQRAEQQHLHQSSLQRLLLLLLELHKHLFSTPGPPSRPAPALSCGSCRPGTTGQDDIRRKLRPSADMLHSNISLCDLRRQSAGGGYSDRGP